MGSNFATELANDLMLDLETQLGIHLTANCYPPAPKSMIEPCIDAIDAYYDEDYNREITLPQGVFYKYKPTAPASALVETYRLDAWLPECD